MIGVGFKKFLGEVASGIKDAYEEHQERKRIEREQEEERLNQLKKEKDDIDKLLDKFEFPDLEKLCSTVLGHKPTGDIEVDEDEEGNKIEKQMKPNRRNYLDFIWENLKADELKPTQIRDFALKNKIVSPSFFGFESNEVEEKREFENIINTIKSQFEPEKIDNEEHLEAQLMIFLKAKFPARKISRQIEISPNERLDILIDDKYAFELKVPRNRSELRNLGAQIQEYSEKYPNICAIIMDDVNQNLTSEITEYEDKYKRDHGIPSIVLKGERRPS